MLQGGPGAGEDGVMVKSMEEDVQGEVDAGGDMAGGARQGGSLWPSPAVWPPDRVASAKSRTENFHYIYFNKIALGLLVTMSSNQNRNTGKKGRTSEKRKAHTAASPSSRATKQP